MTKQDVLQHITDCADVLQATYGKAGYDKIVMLANLNAYNDKLLDVERSVYVSFIQDADADCTVFNAIDAIQRARQAMHAECEKQSQPDCQRTRIDDAYVQQCVEQASKIDAIQEALQEACMHSDCDKHLVIRLKNDMPDEDIKYIVMQIDKLLTKLINKDGTINRDEDTD